MADFEVTNPAGRKFIVTAPEGATQEQVLSYAKNQFAEDKGGSPTEPVLRPHNPALTEAGYVRPPDPRYDPRRFTSEYVWNEVKKVPGAMLGLVPDAVKWLYDRDGGRPTDFGTITRGIQSGMGVEGGMKPPGPGAERLGMIAQNVAGSLPFMGAAIPARGLIGAATEGLAGLGGGLGQVVGHEIAGGKNPWADFVGNIVGTGMAWRAGNVVEKMVPLATSAVQSMASKEAIAATALKARGMIEGSPEYAAALTAQKQVAKREILDDLAKSYAQEDMGKIGKVLDQYDTIASKFPGFRASVGEITGNEPALAIQQKLEQRNIPSLEERGVRVRGNEQAVQDARGSLVPAVPGAGRSALRGVQSSIDDELRALQSRESGLAADLAETSGKSADAAVPVQNAGANIKAAAKEGYDSSKIVADQKYQAFRESIGKDVPADAANVVAKVDELQNKFVFDKQPEVVGLVKGVAEKPGEPASGFGFTGELKSATDGKSELTVNQLHDLSTAAQNDISRELSRQNPDRKVVAQLQAIKDEARATIESALTERGNTDALTKFKEANRYFGKEHAPKYLTGVNLQLRMKDALNEQRIKPEDVVKAYFNPNGITEARRFNQQFADNGAAKESLARGVFDLYKKEVIDKGEGIITDLAHRRFMDKYKGPLAEYPWIGKRLEKNNVAGEIANRMTDARSNIAMVAESQVAKAVGARDPEAFIESALKDKRLMFDSLKSMSPDNRRNMAIAVLNKAWDQSEKGSSAVAKFMDNEANVKMLFRLGFGAKEGLEHLNNIRLLQRALEINEKAPKLSPMTALAEDTLKAQTGTSWTQVMSALRAMGRRPGSGDWFAMVFGGQFMKAKVDAHKVDILKDQLYDPALLKATLQNAKEAGGVGLSDLSGMAEARKKLLKAKLWDLSKAVVGEGVPATLAKRVPLAGATAKEDAE